MSNSKKMLSFMMAVIIIIMSVVSSTAIIAPEDSASAQVQWMYKIDDVLLEKMSVASETDLIPVWVWMTDIDMEQLDKDIETRTGISQQKLDTARAEIGYDVSTISTNIENLNSIDANVQNTVSTYLEATKVQREKIANDTEVYLTAKKALASQRYTTANTTKIRQLGVSNDRIDFQSELTPSFIAFMTKNEIIETAQSDNVVEMGYFSEYDEEPVTESSQVQAVAEDEQTTETEAPTASATLDVSTLHTGMKQEMQHDDALEKYGVTGTEINILFVDNNYVVDDFTNYAQIPHPENIINVMQKQEFSATQDFEIPFDYPENPHPHNDHANFCVAYLQAFAEDVKVYAVAKNSRFDLNDVNELPLDDPNRINTYDDIEYIIENKNIDIICASNNDGYDGYSQSFSAQWFDAIVATYNMPLIASAGNDINTYLYPSAPSSGYNSISVGVYNVNNNQMKNYTYNPIRENDTSRVSYKPDLVVAMDYVPAETPGYVKFGGTSAGAPVVSAIVAMMMELDPSLKGQPEIIKAILMASCHEKAQRSDADETASIDQELMTDGLTLKQGAGKVNALRALNIVEYGTYGYNYISASQNGTVLNGINLNQQGESDTVKYPLNVSSAWLRGNTQSLNNDGTYEITLGDYYNIYLSVYYNGQSSDDIKTSTADNAGKQLVYISEPEWNNAYKIRAYWRNGVNDVRSRVKIGYAYSVGSFEKVLDQIEITGATGIGQTLTANTYTNDGLLMDADELYYEWYSSSDGNSWEIINGANSDAYTLTESDLHKYIKCIVEQDYLCNYWIVKETSTRVVRYGDVDNDGVVSVIDANTIQRYIDQTITLTDLQLLAADVNLDGVVSVMDATLIRQYVGKIIPNLPYTGD